MTSNGHRAAPPTPARRRLALVLLVAASLLGCSSGGDEDVVPTTVATTTVPSTVAPPDEDAIQSYFIALSNGAAATAAPASPAAVFAEHQTVARQLSGGQVGGTVTSVQDGFEWCRPDATCVSYSDVVTDPGTGLLSSFSVDGLTITGRVGGAGVDVEVDGVRVRAVTSLVSGSGQLTVVIEVGVVATSTASLRVFPFAAVYQHDRTPTAIDAVGAWGPETIAVGQTARYLIAFDGATAGGQLRFSTLRADGVAVELEIGVPAA